MAYDDSLRRDSRYVVTDTGKRIQANGYSYPALIFTEKKKESASKTGDITDKDNQQIEVEWDETAQAPFYTYATAAGAKHIVWFENERSWQARLALVAEYGLAGISIWNIMHIFYGGL